MAAPTTMNFHSRTFIHTFHPMGGVFVIELYIKSLSTNEIGRYLNYIQNRKSAARGTERGTLLLLMTTFWVPVFLRDIYTHALLHDCEASRKA